MMYFVLQLLVFTPLISSQKELTDEDVCAYPKISINGTYEVFEGLNFAKCKETCLQEYGEECIAFTVFYGRRHCRIILRAHSVESCIKCATYEPVCVTDESPDGPISGVIAILSSVHDDGSIAENAIDGDVETFAATLTQEVPWIAIAFSKHYLISNISINTNLNLSEGGIAFKDMTDRTAKTDVCTSSGNNTFRCHGNVAAAVFFYLQSNVSLVIAEVEFNGRERKENMQLMYKRSGYVKDLIKTGAHFTGDGEPDRLLYGGKLELTMKGHMNRQIILLEEMIKPTATEYPADDIRSYVEHRNIGLDFMALFENTSVYLYSVNIVFDDANNDNYYVQIGEISTPVENKGQCRNAKVTRQWLWYIDIDNFLNIYCEDEYQTSINLNTSNYSGYLGFIESADRYGNIDDVGVLFLPYHVHMYLSNIKIPGFLPFLKKEGKGKHQQCFTMEKNFLKNKCFNSNYSSNSTLVADIRKNVINNFGFSHVYALLYDYYADVATRNAKKLLIQRKTEEFLQTTEGQNYYNDMKQKYLQQRRKEIRIKVFNEMYLKMLAQAEVFHLILKQYFEEFHDKLTLGITPNPIDMLLQKLHIKHMLGIVTSEPFTKPPVYTTVKSLTGFKDSFDQEHLLKDFVLKKLQTTPSYLKREYI